MLFELHEDLAECEHADSDRDERNAVEELEHSEREPLAARLDVEAYGREQEAERQREQSSCERLAEQAGDEREREHEHAEGLRRPHAQRQHASGAADRIRTISANMSPATEAYSEIVSALRGLPCFASG